MKIKTLRELFEVGLWYAYDCEKKLVKKGLPTMIESATSPDLRSALQQHLEETRGHVARLEQVFAGAGFKADTKDDDVLDELMSSAKSIAGDTEDPAVRDAALIVSGNEVEHYEMAMYGSLVEFARQLGLPDAADQLERILSEEKAADAKLTQIAQSSVNAKAAQQSRAAKA